MNIVYTWLKFKFILIEKDYKYHWTESQHRLIVFLNILSEGYVQIWGKQRQKEIYGPFYATCAAN